MNNPTENQQPVSNQPPVQQAPVQPAPTQSAQAQPAPTQSAQAQPAQQPVVYQQQFVYQQQPVAQLKTNKSLIKYILLNLITFGIYGLVVMSSVSTDINTIASRYDGKRTMHYCLLFFLVAPITFGIGYLVWNHKISARIGAELTRRGIDYSMSAGTFWLWGILGAIIVVGPFVYLHKLFKATNLLCEDFNARG